MLKFARTILSAGLALAATAALAGDLMPDAAEGIMNVCRPDYHRMCAHVVPGSGRSARCLLDREAELSPACLRAIKLASAVEACMPDYRKYCEGVPRGPQAFQCLSSRMDALVPECQRVLNANAPYMRPRGERYSGNPDTAPYRAPNPGGYAYRGGPADEDRDTDEDEPRTRPDGRYAGEGEPRTEPYGRYAGEGEPRPDPYGRYAGEGEGRAAPYGHDAGEGEPGAAPYGRYAGEGEPGTAPYGRYAGEGEPRTPPYDRYAGEGEPRARPYEGDAYRDPPAGMARDPYTSDGTSRFRSYDEPAGGGDPARE